MSLPAVAILISGTGSNMVALVRAMQAGEVPARPALVLSNRSGLETILTNLLDNAIKYTHPGGHVTIDVYAQISHVGVRITDTGIGIPAEALEHVGEEFFRAPNARSANLPGSGLGLSIVNQLLERLAGRLDIQSELDRGTTVNVRLPAA